ncbi:endonuclease MutS2 [Gemella sp. GH3]|uniref:endonuclease MutS2 n=1 Tax=unclassified Gemella TaxID=2624949 RepID=UPI0015CFD55E|nr:MULTISPECIES: endonuclease MutS2 [unclassified Gemella]MBF0713886.1 endonuclease MutS2 [Gemella sp. GH3.1]NYS50838.1 endonuclease MutS2 [Gemella sp. GH3]
MESSINKKLNIDLVLKDVDNYCYSELSKERFKNLEYIKDYNKLIAIHNENEEVEKLLNKYPNEFRLKIYNYYNSIKKAKIESILSEKELFYILQNVITYSRFKNRFNDIKKLESVDYPYISKYIDNIADYKCLIDYLNRIVDEDGYIREDASIELKSIRDSKRKLKSKSDNILKNIIRRNTNKLTEAIITKRNDRDVILVKPEYKNDFGGIIHDESASGNTFYVEPRENVIINNEISILSRKEKEEILKILREATSEVANFGDDLIYSLDNFANVEFIFSKINFANNKGFVKPIMVDSQFIDLKKAYNPLIEPDIVVKNDIYLDNDKDSLIITGPNTGGKTVILKTVGLCVALAHLGLYIPTNVDSKIGYYQDVFIDIGDNQSIENNLSTFSSHMTNIVDILKKVNNKSLVLLDELCSGTDPSEGAGLSMALLNKFKSLGATVLCTTHYPEIKDYCFRSNYYKNASLEFDFDLLKPTYKFIIGLPGKSNAINISYKLGLDENIVEEANSYLKETEKENNIFIDKLYQNIQEYDNKIIILNKEIKEAEKIKNTLSNHLEDYYKYKDSLYEKMYSELNQDIELRKDKLLKIYTEFKESNQSIKQHEFNEVIKDIDSYKVNFSNTIFNIEENNNDSIVIGDDVLVLKYNQRATVLDIKGDVLQIKLGSLKLNIKKSEVKPLAKEKVRESNYINIKNNIGNVSLEINVIGKNTEEALRAIDEYLDKVLLMGYDSFTIIHGVGSGILKKNIAEHLKNNKYVGSYRSGGQNEGGLGVTIVEIV